MTKSCSWRGPAGRRSQYVISRIGQVRSSRPPRPIGLQTVPSTFNHTLERGSPEFPRVAEQPKLLRSSIKVMVNVITVSRKSCRMVSRFSLLLWLAFILKNNILLCNHLKQVNKKFCLLGTHHTTYPQVIWSMSVQILSWQYRST